MLDLEKLEKKLDEALANETPESLRKWLRNNRKKNFDKYLGEGTIEDMGNTSSRFEKTFDTKSVSHNNASTPNYYYYKSAA